MVLVFYQGINGAENVEEIDLFQFDLYGDFRARVITLVYGLDGNGVNGNGNNAGAGPGNANGNNAGAGPGNAIGNNAGAGPVNANGDNAAAAHANGDNAAAAHANGDNAAAAHANGDNAAHFQEIVQALAQVYGEIQMTYVDNVGDEWPLDGNADWLTVTYFCVSVNVQLV